MKEATLKAVSKPLSLKAHKANRAKKIHDYLGDCLAAGEKIDKAFLKELSDIA